MKDWMKHIIKKNRVEDFREIQFWFRVLAFGIDSNIIGGIIMLLIFIPLKLFDDSILINYNTDGFFAFNKTIVIVSYCSSMILYGSIMECSKLKSTFGKYFFRFQVLEIGYSRISFRKFFLRNILKLIAIVSVFGIFMIDMSKKRQGLHDKIAKTIVRRR